MHRKELDTKTQLLYRLAYPRPNTIAYMDDTFLRSANVCFCYNGAPK